MNPTYISLLISFCSLLVVIATFMINRKKDIQQESQSLLKANIKLDQICTTTNETRADIKSINSQIHLLSERQIKTEEEIKNIWRRIDEIKDDIHRKEHEE